MSATQSGSTSFGFPRCTAKSYLSELVCVRSMTVSKIQIFSLSCPLPPRRSVFCCYLMPSAPGRFQQPIIVPQDPPRPGSVRSLSLRRAFPLTLHTLPPPARHALPHSCALCLPHLALHMRMPPRNENAPLMRDPPVKPPAAALTPQRSSHQISGSYPASPTPSPSAIGDIKRILLSGVLLLIWSSSRSTPSPDYLRRCIVTSSCSRFVPSISTTTSTGLCVSKITD